LNREKGKGKPPKSSNKGSPFAKAKIDSHRRKKEKKKKTLEELMKSML
jgi:hypothetical protein